MFRIQAFTDEIQCTGNGAQHGAREGDTQGSDGKMGELICL